MIDYNHAQNKHTYLGAYSAISRFFDGKKPRSLLDVGCGMGHWIKAAHDHGIHEAYGIEGGQVPDELLQVDKSRLYSIDLNLAWNLNRRFDAILCLEVAEHLLPDSAMNLVKSLTEHGDWIFFSAACPGQVGQNHINCQWPSYWQELFNELGFVCDDRIRWSLWDIQEIEPWYRQNLFLASRNPRVAGSEDRIKPVIHPDMGLLIENGKSESEVAKIRIKYDSVIHSKSWRITKPLRLLDNILWRFSC